MASAVYTTAQRDALATALASGVLRVTHEGHSVDYRSLEEMERALSIVQASLDEQAGLRPVYRLTMRTHKGLGGGSRGWGW
jgi:hypothetical protein